MWPIVSDAVEKPDKMRAEKRPLSLATKKRKLTLPKQFRRSRGALAGRREVRKEEGPATTVGGLVRSSFGPQFFHGSNDPHLGLLGWLIPRS